MKSLYTVNKKIKEIEEYERTNPCKQPTMFESSMTITYNQLKKIKKDLEVLKILKKKNVYFQGLKYAIENLKSNEDVLCFYNFARKEEEQLTMEELLKLKRWLEENENDR